jgi:hypothetical protein
VSNVYSYVLFIWDLLHIKPSIVNHLVVFWKEREHFPLKCHPITNLCFKCYLFRRDSSPPIIRFCWKTTYRVSYNIPNYRVNRNCKWELFTLFIDFACNHCLVSAENSLLSLSFWDNYLVIKPLFLENLWAYDIQLYKLQHVSLKFGFKLLRSIKPKKSILQSISRYLEHLLTWTSSIIMVQVNSILKIIMLTSKTVG